METTHTQFTATSFLVWRSTIAIADVADQTMWQTAYGNIYGFLQEQNLEQTGPGVAIYFSWDEAEQKTDMAIGVPAPSAEGMELPEGLSLVTLPDSAAVSVTVQGGYDVLRAAHAHIKEELAAAGTVYSVALEEYLVTGMQDPDPTKWTTKLTYLV